MDLLLVVLQLSLLLLGDSGEYLSQGVELAFQLSLKDDSLGIGIGNILVVMGDVYGTHVLEISMVRVILLLFSNVSILKVVEGVQESVNWLTSLQLEENGIE